uniref:Uncharacterized protein n=1 Tax=Panagrolaimus sp. ES5 TaxID=591445 RepID=A0AC34F723_9BILA
MCPWLINALDLYAGDLSLIPKMCINSDTIIYLASLKNISIYRILWHLKNGIFYVYSKIRLFIKFPSTTWVQIFLQNVDCILNF